MYLMGVMESHNPDLRLIGGCLTVRSLVRVISAVSCHCFPLA
jgi:hypothetical protein